MQTLGPKPGQIIALPRLDYSRRFLSVAPTNFPKKHTATRQPRFCSSWAPISYQTVSVSRNFTAARISCILFRCVGLSSAVLHSVVWGIKAV